MRNWYQSFCTKFCGNFIRFHEVIKLQSFSCSVCTRECIKCVTPGFLCIFCYFYGENTYIIKFYGVLNHFSQICEVAKSWMIKLYHCIGDTIHTTEQTKYVNCGLHVNFWNFINVILFYDEVSFYAKVVTLASGPLYVPDLVTTLQQYHLLVFAGNFIAKCFFSHW